MSFSEDDMFIDFPNFIAVMDSCQCFSMITFVEMRYLILEVDQGRHGLNAVLLPGDVLVVDLDEGDAVTVAVVVNALKGVQHAAGFKVVGGV